MGKNNFKPRHNLEAWVRKYGGTKAVALALGVSQQGVQHWLSGYCNPRPHVAKQILKLSKGKLAWEDLNSEYRKSLA